MMDLRALKQNVTDQDGHLVKLDRALVLDMIRQMEERAADRHHHEEAINTMRTALVDALLALEGDGMSEERRIELRRLAGLTP